MQRTDASALSIYYGAGNIIFLTQLLASRQYKGAWRVNARLEGLRPSAASRLHIALIRGCASLISSRACATF